VILEFCNHGDFVQNLIKAGGFESAKTSRFYFKQLLKGLSHLH
jgi:serine/threonine protein kinase